MFGDMFATYAERFGCFKSYQEVSHDSRGDEDPPLALGTVVRILKGDSIHCESLRMYVGCSAVVIGHSDDNPPLYKLREISTRAEICWFTDEQLMLAPSHGQVG